MRNWMVAALLVFGLLTAESWAQAEAKKAKAKGGRGKAAAKSGKSRWAQIDANGDGVVDDVEAQQAAEQSLERTATQIGTIKERFDENGDGKLDEAEQRKFKSQYESSGKQVPSFMKTLDTNGDWTVSQDEEAAYVGKMVTRFKQGGGARAKKAAETKGQAKDQAKDQAKVQAKGQAKAQAKQRVKRDLANDPDTNDDGLIDDAEGSAAVNQRLTMLRSWLPRMKEKAEAQGDGKVPPRVAVVDTNGDWAISEGEEEVLATRMMQQFQGRNRVVLKHYDADGDGKLAGAEQTAAVKASTFSQEMTELVQRQRMELYGAKAATAKKVKTGK